MWPIALVAILACAQGRAVNISNTWVLPEEGFPVFYRYFWDRISWYEADAVCQFHHANLVTVDTTAQYDAVRAYLKELDISSAVWVGLIRSNLDGDFTWTDYRGLSGDGYWSAAPDARAAPLCAAADPAADYRWEARACGGPTVASFICELPVPQWALGAEGCMVRALPDLTVLYLPESAAVQLTTDCGLDGVKRVLCTGNVKHEEILKNLSCAEETETEAEETLNVISANVSVFSTPWTTATDTSYSDLETTKSQITTKEPTIIVNDVKKILTSEAPMTTKADIHESQNNSSFVVNDIKNLPNVNHNYSRTIIAFNKNLKLNAKNDNVQDNDVPKHIIENDLSMSDNIDELEDEQHMQHKILHDELARHGNFETIFSQPSDHFVPPLVMAKAKMSDDMTVLSLEQKHAQQIAEQHNARYKNRITDLNFEIQNENRNSEHVKSENLRNLDVLETTTKIYELNKNNPVSKDMSNVQKETIKEKLDLKTNKMSLPKKYRTNDYVIKDKTGKSIEVDTKRKHEKRIENDSLTESKSRTVRDKILSQFNNTFDSDDDVSIDLKVIIKAPSETETYMTNNKATNNMSDISSLHNINVVNTSNGNDSFATGKFNHVRFSNVSQVYDHPVIKFTVSNENQSTTPSAVEVATTMTPININVSEVTSHKSLITSTLSPVTFAEESFGRSLGSKIFPENSTNIKNHFKVENASMITAQNTTDINSTVSSSISTETPYKVKTDSDYSKFITSSTAIPETSTETPILSTLDAKNQLTNNNSFSKIHIVNTNDSVLEHYSNATNPDDSSNGTSNFESSTPATSETTEDFRSPLLSGADDPVSKPNRSRRPPIPPNRNKFNPFRILG